MPTFLLLDGLYIEPDSVRPKREGGYEDRIYRKGDRISTPLNLLHFNASGMSPKFQLLHDGWEAGSGLEGSSPQGFSNDAWTRHPAESDEQFKTRLAKASAEIQRALEAAAHPERVVPPTPQPLGGAGSHSLPVNESGRAQSLAAASSPLLASKQHIEMGDYFAKLDKMSNQELKKHAEEEEIDLKSAKDRADILKVIKSSASGSTTHVSK